MRQFSRDRLTALGIEPARDSWDPTSLLSDPKFADQIVTRYTMAEQMESYDQYLAQRAEAILLKVSRK